MAENIDVKQEALFHEPTPWAPPCEHDGVYHDAMMRELGNSHSFGRNACGNEPTYN